MRGKPLFAGAVVAAVLGAVLLAAPAALGMDSIGSALGDEPNAQLCSFTEPLASERSCTVMQIGLQPDRAASESLASPYAGVITSWRVHSGPASPGTAAVRLRLRSFRGDVPIASSQTVALPLSEPGYHTFPTRIRVARAGQVGLTASVSNLAATAAGAPILHVETGVGELYEWQSAFESGESPSPLTISDAELLLSANVEPDRDHDGYGDLTQDHCPSDPEIHTYCHEDHVPPHVRLSFAARQDFLATHKVLVRLRSSEAAHAKAIAWLVIPSRHTIWGMGGSHATVGARGWATLRGYLPGNAAAAARRALAEGRRVYVRFTAWATDEAGNRSEPLRARIEPKR